MKIISRDILQMKIGLKRNYIMLLFPFIGLMIGARLDHIEDERMSKFRDKTALYKRDVPPAKPSW